MLRNVNSRDRKQKGGCPGLGDESGLALQMKRVLWMDGGDGCTQCVLFNASEVHTVIIIILVGK